MQDKTFSIRSWNVRGLGDTIKRATVLSALEGSGSGLLCLQETHLTSATVSQRRNQRFQSQFHSVHSSYSRGVSIMIGRGVAFPCRECRIDEQGRYIFLLCSIENKQYVLANIYTPPFKLEVLHKLLEFTLDKVGTPVIVVGDFNEVQEKSLDRFPTGNRPNTTGEGQLSRFMEEMGLSDIWRMRYPQERQYSCFSSSYLTLCRIDMALDNREATSLVRNIEYGPRGVSNHSPLVLTMNVGGKSQLRE